MCFLRHGYYNGNADDRHDDGLRDEEPFQLVGRNEKDRELYEPEDRMCDELS